MARIRDEEGEFLGFRSFYIFICLLFVLLQTIWPRPPHQRNLFEKVLISLPRMETATHMQSNRGLLQGDRRYRPLFFPKRHLRS
jgi:hypothetical protein